MDGEHRKLIKFSNYSLCITLPAALVRQLKWKKGDSVSLEADEKRGVVTIKKSRMVVKTKPKTERKVVAAKKSAKQSGKKSRW